MPAHVPLSLTTISRLLLIHCSSDDPSHGHHDAKESIDRLMHAGLICYNDMGRYEVTDRGMVYINAIRNLPLPQQKWVMPE
jgi:hypothetical protein